MYVLFSQLQILGTETLFITFRKDYFQNIGMPNNEEHCPLNQLHIIDGILFRKNYNGVLLRCLEKEDTKKVITELHDKPVGGHFSEDMKTHKILRARYYWPTLFKDVHAHVRKCDICQRCGGRQAKAAGPLKLVMIKKPFEQWGLDIIGEIKPNSSLQHKYILMATDYFIRWVEAIPLHKVNEDAVMYFLQDHIMARFGVPISMVFYNATYFSSIILTTFANERGIKLHYSTTITHKEMIW